MFEFEADKLRNVPHPRTNRKIYGHENTINLFLKSLKTEKLHHAWLIHGAKGVGKATLAWKITKLLQNGLQDFDKLEEETELTLISRRIEALSEQSVLLCRRQFDKTKKKFQQEISISEIRKINHFFSLTNTSANYRIVIIDNINELSIPASNALLKILEEPPLNGIFILICENKKSVLPTIISRCRILECNSLNFSNFEKALLSLSKNNLTSDRLKKLFDLSGGSIGKAIELENHNGLEIYEKLVQIIILNNEKSSENVWELISMTNSFDTTKDYHKFLFTLLLKAIVKISTSLATGKNSDSFDYNLHKNQLNQGFNNEEYFSYSLIYSIILEDLNDALRVNLNLADIFFTSILKITKITKNFKSLSSI